MSYLRKKLKIYHGVDINILLNIMIIMFLGIFALASAELGVIKRLDLPKYYFIKKQSLFLLIGTFVMLVFPTLSEKKIKRLIFVGFITVLILLVFVLLRGNLTKGAKRWLTLYNITIQPSEFLKPFYTCFIAKILSYRKNSLTTRIFFICIAFHCVISTLLLLQPDFGMYITNTIVIVALFFIAGIKLCWLILITIVFFFLIYLLYLTLPHVTQRINRFFNPTNMSNYQIQQSLYSYVNGGFLGKGPGEGTIKYVLPDAHTDFIFAVCAEEFGLSFCIIIITTFVVFLSRVFYKLTKMTNLFHIYSIFGILIHFAIQVFFNIAVTLDILPIKGTTLPFISYGGSSILSFSFAIGIYLNMTKKQNECYSKQKFFIEKCE